MEENSAIDIVLVEDNATDAELAMRALKRAGVAHNAICLTDGEQLLDFIFRTGAYEGRAPSMPKVILLDIKLPKVDGLAALRRIKSESGTKQIPVVMLTSSASPNDVSASYQSGANGYLVKPMDFDEFNKTIGDAARYWLMLNKAP
jgi:CheY-like chemotaxis protein